MRAIVSFIHKVSAILNKVSMLMLFMMMLLMVCDISLRYFRGSPILGSYEIVEVLMVVLVFLSFAQTQVQKGHIAVDMIINALPTKLRMAFNIIALACAAGMTIIMTYASVGQAIEVYADHLTSASLEFPLFPFYCVVIIGMAFLSMEFVIDFVKSVKDFATSFKK